MEEHKQGRGQGWSGCPNEHTIGLASFTSSGFFKSQNQVLNHRLLASDHYDSFLYQSFHDSVFLLMSISFLLLLFCFLNFFILIILVD